MPALRSAKQLADQCGSRELQRALAELIDEGHLARHLRRLLRVYRERRDILLAALERHLGDVAELLPSAAGLHTSLYFRDRATDTATVVARALAAGVAVQPLTPYYRGRPRPGLALGYGIIAAPRIDEGIRRLRRATIG